MMSRMKVKHLAVVLSLLTGIYLIDQIGVLPHFKAKDYYSEFEYPMTGDISIHMDRLRYGKDPLVAPINDHDYVIKRKASSKCLVEDPSDIQQKIRVIYLVKSALDHFEHRKIIRKTWGYERRFSDVPIRTVFLLGSPRNPEDELHQKIKEEYDQFGDIVQGDFIDDYYNNTIKAMMGLRWASEICPYSRFYAFFDDDYYVSTRNLLRFLRNPVNYPRYLEEDVIHFDGNNYEGPSANQRKLTQIVDFDLPDDVKLFAGYVIHSRPLRQKFSKWYLSLEDYPYHMLPPYVTGGYVMSNNAVKDFYYASYFVKRFKFDDVYLGLISKKIEIEPFHSDEFHFYHKPYTIKGYQYVVGSHGFSDPKVLEKVWNKQKEAGNA